MLYCLIVLISKENLDIANITKMDLIYSLVIAIVLYLSLCLLDVVKSPFYFKLFSTLVVFFICIKSIELINGFSIFLELTKVDEYLTYTLVFALAINYLFQRPKKQVEIME